jgi:hypothetical protein
MFCFLGCKRFHNKVFLFLSTLQHLESVPPPCSPLAVGFQWQTLPFFHFGGFGLFSAVLGEYVGDIRVLLFSFNLVIGAVEH